MKKNNFGVIDDFMKLNIFENFLCVNFGLYNEKCMFYGRKGLSH